MYPTSGFASAPMAFAFPGQQPSAPLYQSQFAGIGGFNPQMAQAYQQGPQPPRGQSLPASGRQYPPPPPGPYAPGAFISPRRQQHDQYPPPAPSQHYEYHSRHTSKSKKNHKRRSISPGGAGESGLYSDKERREISEGQEELSRSSSPAEANRSKQEAVVDNTQQQQSQVGESSQDDGVKAGGGGGGGGVARSEEEQAAGDHERRRSISKKKKHHRRDRYDNYNAPPTQGIGLDANPANPFQPSYPPQQYLQQPPNFADYQNELPPQLKVHRQPLYSGYNQVYEESIRRGDIYRKQAKRSTRLPPEVKQQLLPHEDDHQNQAVQQHAYPYGPAAGFSQQIPTGPQSLQPFSGIRPQYNPYQTYGPQQGYFGPAAGPASYNAVQPWSNAAATISPAEQEIQRLRSHIHTLEGELHKLQRKLNKTTLTTNNNEQSEQAGRQQDETTRSRRRSKRDDIGSPRQTPVIVELNNTTGEAVRESSSKKHRHRTASNTSAQQGQSLVQQDAALTQRSGNITAENIKGQQAAASTSLATAQISNVPPPDTRVAVNPIGETGDHLGKSSLPKNPREEAAAQLAHAAAAHVNSRQGGNTVPPQPQAQAPQQRAPVPQPQVQAPQQHVPAPQAQVPAPQPQLPAPPPPQVGRPQVPNQQQQQFLYQQGAVRPQGPPIRGPAPGLPAAGNIRFSGDPFRPPPPPPPPQQFHPSQQHHMPNPNYNQSNNNELFDDYNDVDVHDRRQQEEQNRSAEKILDAFERFYLNRGKPTTAPMKVKYIPESDNSNLNTSNYRCQGNTNNNHYRSTSKQSRSQSSLSSSSESIYSNSPVSSRRSVYDNNHRKAVSVITGPFI